MLRIGAISYLNSRPLIHGLHAAAADGRIEMVQAPPAELVDRMERGELDVALLSIAALPRLEDVEVVPGLGIATSGACRSVLLISKCPVDRIETLALDAQSRTSNELALLLLKERWDRSPRTVPGEATLEGSLSEADAAIRIGDKALFESVPEGCEAHDLSQLWMEQTGLPFVFAVWVARRGAMSEELSTLLDQSLEAGMAAVDEIAAGYLWQGRAEPEIARDYLTRCIHYRLGAEELRALEMFQNRTPGPLAGQRG